MSPKQTAAALSLAVLGLLLAALYVSRGRWREGGVLALLSLALSLVPATWAAWESI